MANIGKKRQVLQTGVIYNGQSTYVLSLEDVKKKDY